MNSKEKKVFIEIEDSLDEFMSKMCQLYEVQYLNSENKTALNKISIPNKEKFENMSDFSDSKASRDKDRLLMESMFLRMFVEFERFLSEIIEKSTKNSEIAHKFQDKFQKACREERSIEGENHAIWDGLYNKPLKELLENKNLLIGRHNPVKFASDLFGLGKIEEKKSINKYYFRYLESKERRNCLTHNGTKPSGSYNSQIKRFKKQFKQQKFSELINENNYKHLVFIYDEGKDNRRPLKQNIDDIQNLAVSSKYFNLIFKDIVLLTVYLVLSFKKKYLPEEELSFNCFHDLLKLVEEYKAPEISHVFQEAKNFFGIENFFYLTDTFNQMLMINIGINKSLDELKVIIKNLENLEKQYKKNRINDPKIFIDLEKKIIKVKELKAKTLKAKKTQKLAIQEMTPFDSEEINQEIKERLFEKEDIKKLLLAHLQNSDKDMVLATNSLIKNIRKNSKKNKTKEAKEDDTAIFSWAIFHKFKKKKWFKDNVLKDFWGLIKIYSP